MYICISLTKRLLDILNLSLQNDVFHEEWKTAYIVPLPKINTTKLFDEFRPIYTVPSYEKFLELSTRN